MAWGDARQPACESCGAPRGDESSLEMWQDAEGELRLRIRELEAQVAQLQERPGSVLDDHQVCDQQRQEMEAEVERLRKCRACGHDLLTQHDPEDGTCDAHSGDLDIGVCRCGRSTQRHGDHELTLIERLAYSEKRRQAAESEAAVLADLDRCEHGRHEGDVCGGLTGCNGPSRGNPIARDRVIGFNISRRPIRIPARGQRFDALTAQEPSEKPQVGSDVKPSGESKVPDLMAALEDSLAAARAAQLEGDS